jgi:LSD1 subclass zinc finger protein
MNCPSCGAPLDVLPGTVEVVCPYCNTLILLQKEKIEII